MFYKEKLVALAALNNAQWCASVCQANNVAGQFTSQLWYALGEVPMYYYPNVVTLDGKCDVETVQSITQQTAGSLSIKDSYNMLALATLGFVKLFDAQWLLAPTSIQVKGRYQVVYQVVSNADQLTQWTAALCHSESKTPFNSALFHQESVYMIGIYEGDRVIAGGIVNKSERVVGLTNVFCQTSEATACWVSCLSAAYDIGDGLPVFTYQRGNELTLVKSIGFTEIGPLSVWVRS